MVGHSTSCLLSLKKKRQPYLDAPSHFSGSLSASFKMKKKRAMTEGFKKPA